MRLHIPRADALAIGTALTGAIALAQETAWEHWIKQLVIIVGGLLLAIVVNPSTSTGEGSGPVGIPGPAGASTRPTPPPAGEGGQPL